MISGCCDTIRALPLWLVGVCLIRVVTVVVQSTLPLRKRRIEALLSNAPHSWSVRSQAANGSMPLLSMSEPDICICI